VYDAEKTALSTISRRVRFRFSVSSVGLDTGGYCWIWPENVDSSSKSNPLCHCQKKWRVNVKTPTSSENI